MNKYKPKIEIFCLILSFVLFEFCTQKDVKFNNNECVTPAFNRCIKDFRHNYERKFGKSKFITSVHIERYSSNGLSFVMISHPMNISTINSLFIDKYIVADSSLIIFSTGIGQLITNNQDSIVNEILSQFPKGTFKNDWDEVNHESTEVSTYTPAINGFLINGDSISTFEPKCPSSFYYPTLICPPIQQAEK